MAEQHASTIARLERLFGAILAHLRKNPELAREIEAALAAPERAQATRPSPAQPAPPQAPASQSPPARPPAVPAPPPVPPPAAPPPPPTPQHRPAVLDPFAIYDVGWESMLRERLHPLDVEQLRDVIHQFKLDPTGKSSGKGAAELRDLIVEVVVHRQSTD